MQLLQKIRFGGASFCMPLGAAAAAREKEKGKITIRNLWHLTRFFENEPGFSIEMKEFTVFEQTPLRRGGGMRGGQRPLNAAAFVDYTIVANARDVTWLAARAFLENA